MRLLSWNLNGGDKREVLRRLRCDVAALQERRRCDVGKDEVWWGELPHRGLSVRAGSRFRVERIECAEKLPRYFAPAQARGEESFHAEKSLFAASAKVLRTADAVRSGRPLDFETLRL